MSRDKDPQVSKPPAAYETHLHCHAKIPAQAEFIRVGPHIKMTLSRPHTSHLPITPTHSIKSPPPMFSFLTKSSQKPQNPPVQPRTSSLPASAHHLVPLHDPLSNEERLVLRDRICAISEDGTVVLAVDDMVGKEPFVVVSSQKNKRCEKDSEEGEYDEGFEDMPSMSEESGIRNRMAEREWSLNPGLRPLSLSPTIDFNTFIETWCSGFILLEETGGQQQRIAINSTRIHDIYPDISSPLPGHAVLDFGMKAPWLRIRNGERRVVGVEREWRERVRVRVRGVSLMDIVERVTGGEGWEEVVI